MIGIEGQFLVNIKVGGTEDFLTADDLLEFTVIEEAGNVLPTFILSFRSTNEDILSKLNEGQLVEAKMGATLDTLIDMELSINKFVSHKEGDDIRVYECTGFASKIDYVTDHTMSISDIKSGVEVGLEVAGRHFNVDSNVQKSKDKQGWIQYSISDKGYANNCFMHADLGKSYVATAITLDGTFIARDILKLLQSSRGAYDWKFTKRILTPKDILYDGTPVISSQSGFINNWLGYGRTTLAYDLNKGTVIEIKEDPETLLSLSNELDKVSNIDERFNGTRVQNDNVHANFYKAHNHNLQGLVSLSRLELAISVSKNYFAIRPLEIVMFSEKSTQGPMSGEGHTGLYIVSKVIRTVMGKMMTTTVLLNREALNNVTNEV